MTALEHGYNSYPLDNTKARAESLLETLTEEQRQALRELAKHQSAYYADVRQYLTRVYTDTLADPDVDEEQKLINLVLEACDVVLRGITKFGLGMSEIIALDKMQGELPSMESERIIDI